MFLTLFLSSLSSQLLPVASSPPSWRPMTAARPRWRSPPASPSGSKREVWFGPPSLAWRSCAANTCDLATSATQALTPQYSARLTHLYTRRDVSRASRRSSALILLCFYSDLFRSKTRTSQRPKM